MNQLTKDPVTGLSMIGNEVLACFSTDTDVNTISTIANLFSGTIIGRFSEIGNCYQFGLPAGSDGATVESALALLRARPEVTSADPDLGDDPGADPCFLMPVNPTCSDPSYGNVLHLGSAHFINSGSGVIIAVLDSGVDY